MKIDAFENQNRNRNRIHQQPRYFHTLYTIVLRFKRTAQETEEGLVAQS